MTSQPALFYGPNKPELWRKTIASLIDEQENRFGDRTAIVVPWQSVQLTYRQLAERSRLLAKAMLDMGLKHGDCVGIMAGNCYQYIEIFLAGGRIGCPVVVLNNTYTAKELVNAVHRSLLFISPTIGRRRLATHLAALTGETSPDPALPELRRVVLVGPIEAESQQFGGVEVQGYNVFASTGESIFVNSATSQRAERKVSPEDVLNLQFTSGTTGSPKAAMLTHINILNDGRFVGAAMRLTPSDIIVSPPPLFHCFGLVMGFLASFIHGSSTVFPSENFDASKAVDALITYNATAILGVPTMFIAEMEVLARTRKKPRGLRTGLASGASVMPALMWQIKEVMGVQGMLIPYGMTEASPVTFITSFEDEEAKRVGSVGRVLPHTAAKVVDPQGNIVAVGKRGELRTSGFALQKGYWRNEEKTREVMKMDEDGRVWMFTGDEAVLDEGGYARITGRIKDIIIRGGENIFPLEIEERLMAHAFIAEASVVGIKDEKYGEVVGCFLKKAEGAAKISDEGVREHVSSHLGRHKAPHYIFWIGDAGVGSDFPKTGSGKHQKHILREIGDRLVKTAPRARL
ncbi:hypothetical protein BDV12DRAFT_189728 [Aspergillus spectabilis]